MDLAFRKMKFLKSFVVWTCRNPVDGQPVPTNTQERHLGKREGMLLHIQASWSQYSLAQQYETFLAVLQTCLVYGMCGLKC